MQLTGKIERAEGDEFFDAEFSLLFRFSANRGVEVDDRVILLR